MCHILIFALWALITFKESERDNKDKLATSMLLVYYWAPKGLQLEREKDGERVYRGLKKMLIFETVHGTKVLEKEGVLEKAWFIECNLKSAWVISERNNYGIVWFYCPLVQPCCQWI